MRLLARAIGRPHVYYHNLRGAGRIQRRCLTNNGFFRVSEEVREALHSNKPVVALETTIYTHGFPYPDNVALASHLESVVRVNGGVPATIGIIDGVAVVGMSPEELIQLTSSAGKSNTFKLSRRDLSFVGGMRLTDKLYNGGTTISGTMVLAHLAGIKIFGTGGLGGVHRGAESSMDISADLTELGRTPVTVISSGCKSFLDIPRTIEYLETEGVGVGTFADGREGEVDFPAFWSRDSGVKSPTTIKDEMEAAAIIFAQHSLQISSGLHFANPVPEQFAIPKAEMDVVIEEALREATALDITGKDNTPFILHKIKELTKGKSIPANRALIESNVKRATIVARELAALEAQHAAAQGRLSSYLQPAMSSSGASAASESSSSSLTNVESSSNSADASTSISSADSSTVDIIVAGALAVDFSCDYSPLANSTSPIDPVPHTSNPAVITQTIGGVAHNIAKAAHLLGSSVCLFSAVGDDLSGRAALSQLANDGLSVRGIETVSKTSRTAQYVSVNNANKDLAIAMADMSILETIPLDAIEKLTSTLFHRKALTTKTRPSVVVADANWSSDALYTWLQAARHPETLTIFEPVSTAKALRIFPSTQLTSNKTPHVFPDPLADIITPNTYELSALHDDAAQAGLFNSPAWFRVIDALGVPASGLRVPLSHATSPELVDQGTPQMAIKLLPFFPTILTKLGPGGVLMVKLLTADAEELHDDGERRYVLARNGRPLSEIRGQRAVGGDEQDRGVMGGGGGEAEKQDGIGESASVGVGGLYVRLFPTERVLAPDQIVSVNGIGDTFCGALASGLAGGGGGLGYGLGGVGRLSKRGEKTRTGRRRVQDIVPFAQSAAALSLQSKESVSPALAGLAGELGGRPKVSA